MSLAVQDHAAAMTHDGYPPVIELRGVVKRYPGGVAALGGVDGRIDTG